ncbi:MAG: hypothetical protein V7K32_03575 [Nostoc sp.]
MQPVDAATGGVVEQRSCQSKVKRKISWRSPMQTDTASRLCVYE